MRSVEVWKRKQMKNPAFRAEYRKLAPEFATYGEIIRANIRLGKELALARKAAKFSQREVARRMGSSQSAVARLESGRSRPSISSLVKFARAVRCKVEIKLIKVR